MKQIQWPQFEDNLRNKGVTQRRINKLHTMYNVTTRLLGKNPEQASRTDLERVVSQLHRNEAKSEKTRN